MPVIGLARDMVDEPHRTLRDLVRHVGRYPEDAFHFVREGLAKAAEQVHGPETKAHRRLYKYLFYEKLDWCDLVTRYQSGELPEPVVQAIEQAGGCEKLDRHVSGRELCWALRDFAIDRWGMLARTVLESWNLKSTADFGRIVFGFIEFDLMQKQPGDRIEDFEDVYCFEEAFDHSLSTGLGDSDGSPRR